MLLKTLFGLIFLYSSHSLTLGSTCEWSWDDDRKTAHPNDVAALIDCINDANQDEKDNIINLGDQTFTLIEGPFSDGHGDNGLPRILPDCDHKLTIKNGRILRSRDNDIPNFRLLEVEEDAHLILECVTLENGLLASPVNPPTDSINEVINQNGTAFCGGAILNEGKLEVERSIISDNRANFGGGICNEGVILHIDKTTIVSNNAFIPQIGIQLPSSGGGIYNLGYIKKIKDSTFNNNLAGDGAAIYNDNYIDLISNSTFSTNGIVKLVPPAPFPPVAIPPGGGAIYNNRFIRQVSNNTFADNTFVLPLLTSPFGNVISGGIFLASGSEITYLISNLFADDFFSGDIQTFSTGGLIKNATYNFIRNRFTHTIDNIVTGDEVTDNNNLVGFDIILGPLANNGGPTATHALICGSSQPAINNGANPDNLRFDQRGWPFNRDEDGQTDIGAYEIQKDEDVANGDGGI